MSALRIETLGRIGEATWVPKGDATGLLNLPVQPPNGKIDTPNGAFAEENVENRVSMRCF